MDEDLGMALSILDVKWTVFSIAASLSTLRYYIRRSKNGCLEYDDWVHLFAFTMCFCYAVVTSVESQIHAEQTDPGPGYQELWFAMRTCYHVFYWVTIFACKAVFLALYRGIFGVSRLFTYGWWATVVITFLAFIVAMVSNFLTCGMQPGSYTLENCEEQYFDPALVAHVVPPMSIVTNVLTDLLLMILPLSMLSRFRLRRSQVKKLIPICLLGIITIVFTTAAWTMHAVQVQGKAGAFAADMLLNLEPIVGVIVSALPAVLFVSKNRKAHPPTWEMQTTPQQVRAKSASTFANSSRNRPAEQEDCETLGSRDV